MHTISSLVETQSSGVYDNLGAWHPVLKKTDDQTGSIQKPEHDCAFACVGLENLCKPRMVPQPRYSLPMEILPKFKWIVAVHLQNLEVRVNEVSTMLHWCNGAEEVTIMGCYPRLPANDVMSQLPKNVKCLTLSNLEGWNKGIHNISRLDALQTLILSDSNQATLTAAVRHPQGLCTIAYRNFDLGDQYLTSIVTAGNLASLRLPYCKGNSQILQTQAQLLLPLLTELDISGWEIDSTTDIGQFPKTLKYLIAANCSSLESMSTITALQALHQVVFDGCSALEVDLEAMGTLPKLRKIGVAGVKGWKGNLSDLSQLSRLDDLNVAQNKTITTAHLTDIASLPLRKLNIHGCDRVNPIGLFPHFSTLQRLVCTDNALTDKAEYDLIKAFEELKITRIPANVSSHPEH